MGYSVTLLIEICGTMLLDYVLWCELRGYEMNCPSSTMADSATLDTLRRLECRTILAALQDALADDLVAAALFGSWARGDATETSDMDMLVIAEHLPDSLWERQMRLRGIVSAARSRIPSLIALTQQEFESHFPSYYLDLALDAYLLYDPSRYLAKRLDRAREVMDEAGLYRTGRRNQFFWNWRKPPRANWELTWEGYRELT